VHFVADLMAEDKWPCWPDSLVFRRMLGDIWGVSESSVRAYAAEAHRMVALNPEDRAVLQEELAKRMKRIADDAETRCSTATGLPDYGSAVKALESYAKFSGIELEQKVKLSGSVKLEDLDALRRKVEGDSEG